MGVESGMIASSSSLGVTTDSSSGSVSPLSDSAMSSTLGLAASLDGSTGMSIVRATSTNTNIKTVDPPLGLNFPDTTPSSGSLAASGGSAGVASVEISSTLDASRGVALSSSLMGGSSSSPSVLVDAQFRSSDDSTPTTNMASSNVASSSSSSSLTVTLFLIATSDVSALDDNSPATGSTISPETPSLSAATAVSSKSPSRISDPEPTSTVFTTTTSTSSATSKAKTTSPSSEKGGFSDLSRSISSPPGLEKTKTSFTSTTTTTTFLSRQTVTVTITTPSCKCISRLNVRLD